MPRAALTLTEEQHSAVATYQKRYGLASWSQAATALILSGLQAQEPPSTDVPRWGGERELPTPRKREYKRPRGS